MITTSRCVLKTVKLSDYEGIKELYQNKEVREFLGGTKEEEAIKEIIDNVTQSGHDTCYCSVREKRTNEFIGLISLDTHHSGHDTEVSYQFLPKWWGSGYATEVVGEITRFALEKWELPRIVAETQTANRRSCKLLERVGMKVIDSYPRFGADQSLYALNRVST
ncbi:N-acetyltransferase [Halobacillus fulvus]|nr:N-acetyltransferase [Halobacillus fulvus]